MIIERLLPTNPLALRTTDDGAKSGESDMELNIQFLAKKGVIDPITGNIAPHTRIVEFGSGRGGMALELAQRGAELVVGVELNAKDIRQAQSDAHRLGLKNVVFVQADAQELPFEPGSFAHAMSFDNLEHIPDLEKHLREVYRVLEQDGSLLFETPNMLFDPFYQLTRRENGQRVHTWQTYRAVHCSTQFQAPLAGKIEDAGFQKPKFTKMPFYDEVFKNKVRKTPFGILLPFTDFFPVEQIPTALRPMFHGEARK